MSTGQQNPNFSLSTSSKQVTLFYGPQALADEGSYFVATNPTPGTGIATTTSVVDDAATASSTHAQASPVMVITNQWSSSDPNQKCIYLDYLKMLLTSIPTSATRWDCAMRLDMNPTRITTAGTVITPVPVNSNSGVASKAGIQFGAITTALPTGNARLVNRTLVNSVVPVVLDQWLFSFNASLGASGQLSNGSAPKNLTFPCAPIMIAPGWSLTVEMWGASNGAAPAWEFELGYAERPSGQ